MLRSFGTDDQPGQHLLKREGGSARQSGQEEDRMLCKQGATLAKGRYRSPGGQLISARLLILLFVSYVLFNLSGCVTTSAYPRFQTEEPLPVLIALVRDDMQSRETKRVPDEVMQAVADELALRNISSVAAGEGGYTDSLSEIRSSSARLNSLFNMSGEIPLVLLVETRALFYSQLSGRYRWTVQARLTLAPAADTGRAMTFEINEPVFLFYDHEREDQALAEAAGRISRHAGIMVDEALASGWPGLPETLIRAGKKGIRKTEIGVLSEADTIRTREVLKKDEKKEDISEHEAERDRSHESVSMKDFRALPAPPGDILYFAMVDRFARPGGGDQKKKIELSSLQDFFGGTISGLNERLDWLETLGVGSLWISPVYLSREDPFHGWGAFHGYWVEDHMKYWPRLGSFEEIRKLSDDLSERGIRLLLDIVVNHVGYDAPLTESRPDWFNDLGSIEDWNCPRQLIYGDVHGLPDLDQYNPKVYEYLLNHAKLWIDEVRPDGFRLDAVKHVPLSFWQNFNADIKAFAGEDFYLLGEDLEGDPYKLSVTMKEGGFDALFDFPLHFALVDLFCRGASPGRLAAMLSMDRLYEDAGSSLVTFLDNHDLPRISGLCKTPEKVKQALITLVLLRGTPALTWGTETGLTGIEEPFNRAPMVFDSDHPMRQDVMDILAIRKTHPDLVDADTVIKTVTEDFLVILRLSEKPLVLAINMADEYREYHFRDFTFGGGRSLVSDLSADESQIRVPPGRVEVFEFENNIEEDADVFFNAIKKSRGSTSEPGPLREIIFNVEGEFPQKAEIVLTGAGEELGHWNLEEAVQFRDGTANISLPSGIVAEYKLVMVNDSDVLWETGPNRYMLIKPGDEPLSVDIEWRQEG